MLLMRFLSLALILTLSPALAQLRPGDPASVGISRAGLARAIDRLRSEVREGRVDAASILVARRGRIVLHQGLGHLSSQPANRRRRWPFVAPGLKHRGRRDREIGRGRLAAHGCPAEHAGFSATATATTTRTTYPRIFPGQEYLEKPRTLFTPRPDG